MAKKTKAEIVQQAEVARNSLGKAIAALQETERGQNILVGLNGIARDVAGLDLAYAPHFGALAAIMADGQMNGTVKHMLELAAIQISRTGG